MGFESRVFVVIETQVPGTQVARDVPRARVR